eukprot:763148-Hanusia_phi.AAC.1
MEGFGRAGEEVGVVSEVGPGGGEDRGRESMVEEVEGVEESNGEVDGEGRGRHHQSLGIREGSRAAVGSSSAQGRNDQVQETALGQSQKDGGWVILQTVSGAERTGGRWRNGTV